MTRIYNPRYQAQRAERIRNHTDPVWDRFHRLWAAFNALYNAVQSRTERDRVRAVTTEFLSREAANALIARIIGKWPLPEPPPGDTRYEDSDPRFRRCANAESAIVQDESRDARERIGAIMVLVYQVRCSLLHGNKSPSRKRDNELVQWGVQVLEEVVPVLEDAMSAV